MKFIVCWTAKGIRASMTFDDESGAEGLINRLCARSDVGAITLMQEVR